MNIGVFAGDPGGQTGLAWGIFDPDDPDGLAGALRNRMNAGSTTIEGDERTQIVEMSEIWEAFFSACVRSALLPVDSIYMVMENFVLKPGQTAGGKDSTISLSLIWGLEGYRMGKAAQFNIDHPKSQIVMPEMRLQMAGQAKSVATKARMKDWDIWVVGREHERSAWAHIALFLKIYMKHFGR